MEKPFQAQENGRGDIEIQQTSKTRGLIHLGDIYLLFLMFVFHQTKKNLQNILVLCSCPKNNFIQVFTFKSKPVVITDRVRLKSVEKVPLASMKPKFTH